MIPREFLVEMVQFIALTLNGVPANLDKLPALVAVLPPEMAARICSKEIKDHDKCTVRAAGIAAAYVREENTIYYNARIVHPEASGLGRAFIEHELTHWYQDVDFSKVSCAQLKEYELQAYRVQDAFMWKEVETKTNFAAKFEEKFTCHDKN